MYGCGWSSGDVLPVKKTWRAVATSERPAGEEAEMAARMPGR